MGMVLAVPQMPKVSALRVMPDMLEARSLAMVPALVMRLLVVMVMRRMAPYLVRMALVWVIAVRLVPSINNAKHKPSPPIMRP